AIIDITAYMERKLKALLCHRSQLGEDVVEMVKGWDKETGKPHGLMYAETFRVMTLKPEAPPEAGENAS
ncbi:MAG: hypothetical protein JNJ78_10625, partial [Anaerolineae bacterium]|nr:hypothetical protein [Anaerolineae bacterium]